MCVLALQYKTARDASILVAANREEYYDRPTQAPRIQSGRPRVICGIDRKAGGTWFGVNQHAMFAAVANRFRGAAPVDPRSRGLLCREMLNQASSREAAEYAAEEMKSGKYAGANFICADMEHAFVVQCGGRLHDDSDVRVIELEPGLHIFSEAGVNDFYDERQEFVRRLLTLQRLDSAVAFLAVAAKTFARKPDAENRRGVVVCGENYGTVSSTLLSLAKRPHNAVYHYAAAAPSERSYDDLSALLRQVLSTDK
ncbi:MAG: NRDE family protein [Thermoguttaceae bacterium]|nr:NRDE family protein [Thermoguttaceae bacterium]